MNDESGFGCLTGEDLAQVAGGMTRSNALIAEKVYFALGSWYHSLGMSNAGALYDGMGLGVVEGAS